MGGNALNMWGFWPSGAWLRNDPLLNVGALRGKSVYISSGAGSTASDPTVDPDSASFDPVKFSQTVPLETASGLSSKVFVPAAQRAGANLQTHITDDGLHTWNYWQDRLHESWANTLAPALGTS
jgi:S-formylglutathione hydrolase FrmB